MMGNGNADYFPKDRLLGSPAVRVPPLKLEAILQQRNSAQPIRTCKSSAQAVPIPDPKVSLSSLCTLNNEDCDDYPSSGEQSQSRTVKRIAELIEDSPSVSGSHIPRLSPGRARSAAVEAAPPYSEHPSEIPRGPSDSSSPVMARPYGKVEKLRLSPGLESAQQCGNLCRQEHGMQSSLSAHDTDIPDEAPLSGTRQLVQHFEKQSQACSHPVTVTPSVKMVGKSQRYPRTGDLILGKSDVNLACNVDPNLPHLQQRAYFQEKRLQAVQKATNLPDIIVAWEEDHNLDAEEVAVQVVVRIRPRFGLELKAPGVLHINQDGKSLRCIDQNYAFDAVLCDSIGQEAVYLKYCKPLVESFLCGQNATMFAYGQTGSGKTYTMGTASEPPNGDHEGCLTRALSEVFQGVALKRKQEECEYEISVTFTEIYNEELRDLFNPSTSSQHIRIRETACGDIIVSSLREVVVATAERALGLFRSGCMARATGSTKVNQRSSRSHAVFTLNLKQLNNGMVKCKNKLNLVDLAGSERNKKTGAVGKRFKEAISINKGLLALGNVITALSDSESRARHIPYRDSKITRLLQDSLGGDHRTCMIACLSPTASNLDETLNTLKYASRARNITNQRRKRLDDKTVCQSLVNYSMGTAPDIAAIPEDIAAAITPAAAVQAVYAIRQQRKEEHRHLMMASAESDALRAQLQTLQQEWELLRADRDHLQSRMENALNAGERGKFESRLWRMKSESAWATCQQALPALKTAARKSVLNAGDHKRFGEIVEQLEAQISEEKTVSSSSKPDWCSHPISLSSTPPPVSPEVPRRSTQLSCSHGTDEERDWQAAETGYMYASGSSPVSELTVPEGSTYSVLRPREGMQQVKRRWSTSNSEKSHLQKSLSFGGSSNTLNELAEPDCGANPSPSGRRPALRKSLVFKPAWSMNNSTYSTPSFSTKLKGWVHKTLLNGKGKDLNT